MQIFEYAVMIQEKRDVSGNIVTPAELLVEPTYTLAKNDQAANLIAGAAIPQEVRDDPEKMDRLLVAVRPF